MNYFQAFSVLCVKFLFSILFLSNSTFSQSFEIAWGAESNFTIDKFANDVYYYFIPANKIYKTELKTLESLETEYPTIPRFAHNSHLAVYSQQNNLYLHDFELDTTFLLLSTPQGFINTYVFSPNDSNIFISDSYYSFKDSQVYALSFEISYWNTDYYEWSSDSTIISSINDNVIIEYYLYSNRIDTLYFIGANDFFRGFTYSITENKLAYSLAEYPPKLYLYNFETSSDSVLFDPMLDDSSQIGPCWTNPIAITSLNWAPNEKRLGFVNSLDTNPGGGLYTFESDSGFAKMLFDCSNFGNKYNLEWLRNDTLIYYDASTSIIYGIDGSNIVDDVSWRYQENIPENIHISNYPNPFNPATNIGFRIPEQSNVKIIVYDILGRKVTTLLDEEKSAGEYEIIFDAEKYNLSSGVYFYKLKTEGGEITRKMILLR